VACGRQGRPSDGHSRFIDAAKKEITMANENDEMVGGGPALAREGQDNVGGGIAQVGDGIAQVGDGIAQTAKGAAQTAIGGLKTLVDGLADTVSDSTTEDSEPRRTNDGEDSRYQVAEQTGGGV
jgi:hypothetical protein